MQYMDFMFLDIIKLEFKTKTSAKSLKSRKCHTSFGPHFLKWVPTFSPKPRKNTFFPYFSMYLAMQYMNFIFCDITEVIYFTETFKMAANFYVKNGCQNCHQNPENGIFPLFFNVFGHAINEFYIFGKMAAIF